MMVDINNTHYHSRKEQITESGTPIHAKAHYTVTFCFNMRRMFFLKASLLSVVRWAGTLL